MMKTTRTFLSLLTLLFLTQPLLARNGEKATPSPSASPSVLGDKTPAPVELPVTPGEAVKNSDPFKQVDEFFRLITEGRITVAYDQLLKGTFIAAIPNQVTSLKTQTTRAIEAYGDIMGYENVDKKELGTRMVRLTYISMGKQLPMRWRFYFYKATDAWKLIDLRVSDRITDMFEEPPVEVQRPEVSRPEPARSAESPRPTR